MARSRDLDHRRSFFLCVGGISLYILLYKTSVSFSFSLLLLLLFVLVLLITKPCWQTYLQTTLYMIVLLSTLQQSVQARRLGFITPNPVAEDMPFGYFEL